MSRRAAIAMWFDARAAVYGNIAVEINQRFASKHGFKLAVSHCVYRHDRHPSWQKVGWLLELLHSFETVIWLDADACLVDARADRLFALLRAHRATAMVFSRDLWGVGINAGAIVIRRTPAARAILRTLLDIGRRHDNATGTKVDVGGDLDAYCSKFLHARYWEQSCIQRLWDTNHAAMQEHSTLLPYGVLQVAADMRGNLTAATRKTVQPPIMHVMGRGDGDRVESLCALRQAAWAADRQPCRASDGGLHRCCLKQGRLRTDRMSASASIGMEASSSRRCTSIELER